MPDWSYQNIFRPLLFKLPAAQARDSTLRTVGRLARSSGGQRLIEFMGHMTPPRGASVALLGWRLPSRVVIGAGTDPHALGSAALARFGAGLLEIGAVTLHGVSGADEVRRDAARNTLEYPHPNASMSLAELEDRLVDCAVRRVFRLGWDDLQAQLQVVRTLEQHADGFTVMPPLSDDGSLSQSLEAWRDQLEAILGATTQPVFALVPLSLSDATLRDLIELISATPIAGFALLEGLPTAGMWGIGPASLQPALCVTAALRAQSRLPIIAAGGVQSPRDALRLLEAGADLVSLHAGLVYAGPGLPKRINTAVAARGATVTAARDATVTAARDATAVPARAAASLQAPITLEPSVPTNTKSWVWLLLLGLGMILSGALVASVGATRATLPYDEAFLGVSRAELERLNPYLLDFLRHDRVTLAGTMLSIGTLYAMLAWHGVRRGQHWAWNSIRWSALVGFLSFFLFLLYGYFDALHALASVLLLPLFALGIVKPPKPQPAKAKDFENDRVWRIGLVGQLAFVATGLGLILAGVTIAGVGAIEVFVPQDLEFMRTTRSELQTANAQLIALIAHDRSGFGGALWSVGIAVLTSSLWGFERGRRWLWWTLLLSGSLGFALTLGVHAAVGYTNLVHLLPAYAGFCLFTLGLTASMPYLFDWRDGTQSATAQRQSFEIT